MFLVFIIVFCALIALGFGAAAAWSDANRLIIPNNYSLFIVAAFVPAFLLTAFLAPDISFFASWKNHLLGGAIVFAVTYGLFHFGLIGGGDSKLMSAYGLWTGLSGLMPLFFFMALSGGVLGAVTLFLRHKKPIAQPKAGSWIEKAQAGENKVPYGVAIFVGALVAFWQLGYIQLDNLTALAANEAGVSYE